MIDFTQCKEIDGSEFSKIFRYYDEILTVDGCDVYENISYYGYITENFRYFIKEKEIV